MSGIIGPSRLAPLAGTFLAVVAVHPSSAQTPFQSAIQADDPILWYQLNEAAGNAVNHGSLGATHDATYNGTIFRQVATIGGDTGIGVDTTDDYLESLGTSTLTGNPSFSIEMLICLPTNGAAGLWGPYLQWGSGSTGEEVYFSVQSNNLDRIFAGFYNGGQRTANTLALSEWLHVVWTREGGNDSATGTTLYVNGVSVPLEQDPNLIPGFLTAGQINVNSTVFRINRGQDFIGTRFWTGVMDEIALYDRVLDASEVLAHFNAIDPFATYCSAGTSASGCQASISATGSASASAVSGFDLSASLVEGDKNGIFFFGSNGRQASPWGNGTSYQCVIPPVKRGGLLTGSGTAGACDGSFTQDLNALWCQVCPKPNHNPGAGVTVQAQLWFRDPFNTSNQTTSLSNAIEFTVCP